MKKVKLIILNPLSDLNNYEHRPRQEATFLKEMGYDVEVIILQRKITGKGIVKNTIGGIPVRHYLCKTENMEKVLRDNKIIACFKPIIHFIWFLKFMIWLRKELKKEGDYNIWAHNIEMAFASCIVRSKKRSTLTFVMRELYEGQAVRKTKKLVIGAVSRFIQNRSDNLVYVVPYQKQATRSKNQSKLIYIPNYPQRSNYRDVAKTESAKLRINYIGCVRDEKSLKMLMDAAKDIEGIEVGIHGEGDAYPYLKSIEANYDNVSITGYYDYIVDTEKLFSDTDILYCAYDTSIFNWKIAYPIKLYEAIETNIPVLICRGMAPEEFVVKNDFGYVFKYNVESLRKMLVYLCDNPASTEKKVLKMKAIDNPYIWENVVQKYLKTLM